MRKNLKKIIALIILLLILAGLFTLRKNSQAQEVEAAIPVTVQNPNNNLSYKAPPLSNITKWINTDRAINLNEQHNRVILLHFFRTSCKSCMKMTSQLNEFDLQYRDRGLMVIGIHSQHPANEAERKTNEADIYAAGIKYPIAFDENLASLNNYKVKYMPTTYLIDKLGNVAYTQIGEGVNNQLETQLRQLLNVTASPKVQNDSALLSNFVKITAKTEIGSNRSDRNMNFGDILLFPMNLPLHYWALSDQWDIHGEYSETLNNIAAIRFHFYARKVLVMMESASGQPINVDVRLGGNKLDKYKEAGSDVLNSTVSVKEKRYYEVLSLGDAQNAFIEMRGANSGLRIYNFVFAN